MDLFLRALVSSLFVAASLAMWSGKVRAEEPPVPPVTVECSGPSCAITIALDAATAVAQIEAANLAAIEDPASAGITSARMVRVFAGAVGLVFFFWGLGYAVGVAVGLVRKV